MVCYTKVSTLTKKKSTKNRKIQTGFLESIRRKVNPEILVNAGDMVVYLENQRKSIRAFNVRLIAMSISKKPNAFLIYQQ